MAGMKEIRGKIKSVQNTRKITKAMEMVAASKMRRAQERMRAARPYADKIRDIAAHMSACHARVSPPVHGRERRRESGRHHPRHDRQRSVRRHEHEHPACVAPEVQGTGAAGQDDRSIGDRQQGSRLPESSARQGRVASHASGRHAASGKADRRGEGAARPVLGRQDQRGVPGVHALRQHDEAGSR